MKLLSITIPCYNSEKYMRHCIDSLLPGGNEVEILIVNDGSLEDCTGEVADEYEKKYPGICRAIHQENGGHGAAINIGLQHANGIFFKVVDSDDWVDLAAYMEILAVLRGFVKRQENLDMLISNFVYEKQGAVRKRVVGYRTVFPLNKRFTWSDVRRFGIGQYILMHSVIYRSELLRECGLVLPGHTFYVDNIFVYQPLPYVEDIYYLDVNFYRYFIGRKDQSVNETVMIGRLDQQIEVTRRLISCHDVTKIHNRMLRSYMIRYIEIMMAISSILAIKSDNEENIRKKQALWGYLREQNYPLYLRLRLSCLGMGTNLPGTVGRKCSIAGYKIAQKYFGFN